MKNLLTIITVYIILFCLSGCKIQTEGDSLNAFTNRMNEIDEYNLTSDGYIYEEKENTLSKFYVSEGKNLLLSFKSDNGNHIQSMNIVFDSLAENNTYTIKFISDCIASFINDTAVYTELMSALEIEKAITEKSYITKTQKIGSIEILIDTTDVGVMITVNKI